MEEMSFIDIYIETVLRDIKICVSKKVNLCNEEVQDISGDRIGIADKKMRVVLKDILLHSTVTGVKVADSLDELNYNFMIFQDDEMEKAKRRFKCYLVLYYTALYFGNVKLLSEMLRNCFDFGDDPNDLALCLLDDEITKRFEFKDYLEIIEKSSGAIIEFYDSINDIVGKDRNSYLDKFSRIIKKHKDIPSNALRKYRLDIFDEDTYLKATKEQLAGVISSISGSLSEEVVFRLNNLIKNNDSFNGNFGEYTEILFSNFADEDILNLDSRMAGYYARALEAGVDLDRMKKLYSLNNLVANYRMTTNKNFLNLFSDEEIAVMNDKIFPKFIFEDPFFYENYKMTVEDAKRIRKKYEELLNGKNGSVEKKSKIKALIGLGKN